MRKSYYLFLILLQNIILAQQYSQIEGTVKDSATGEPLIGANILVVNTNFGAATDIDGKFVIENIPSDTYQLTASYIGYNSVYLEDIKVSARKSNYVSFELSLDTVKKHGVLDSATISFVFLSIRK